MPHRIFVVDDDETMRIAIDATLRPFGHDIEVFATARAFIERISPAESGCVLLDVRLPDASGLDVYERLVTLNIDMPIIFITGHGDVSMAAKAKKVGAFALLVKPFSEQILLDTVQAALACNERRNDPTSAENQ